MFTFQTYLSDRFIPCLNQCFLWESSILKANRMKAILISGRMLFQRVACDRKGKLSEPLFHRRDTHCTHSCGAGRDNWIQAVLQITRSKQWYCGMHISACVLLHSGPSVTSGCFSNAAPCQIHCNCPLGCNQVINHTSLFF